MHVTKIVNGKKLRCTYVRRAQELRVHLNIDRLTFASLFDHSKFAQKITQPKACPVCRLTLEDFRQINQFGCSECYTTFRSEIEPLLRRLHGSSSHEGKIPARSYADLSVERQIKLLREKLQQMISVENYEEAARIRDQIRALEHQS